MDLTRLEINRRRALLTTAAIAANVVNPMRAFAEETPRKGGVFNVHYGAEQRQLNPSIQASTGVYIIGGKIQENLVDLDSEGKPVGVLAESWEASPDGKTITFKLRKGITWHDGKPFTSADVEFTAMNMWKKILNYGSTLQLFLTAVDTPDPQTAIFRYERPMPLNLLLRALPDLYVAMADEATRALELLNRALTLDPDYALAHGYAAWCHEIRFVRAGQDPVEREAAIRHAYAAITHGPDDANALSMAAFVLAMISSDMATARKAFEQALAVSPSCFFALGFGSAAFGWKGEAERAIDWGERARRISPFDRLLYGAGHGMALGYFMRGDSDKAAEAARLAIQVKPEFSLSHVLLAAALSQAGRHDEAKAAGAQALALQADFSTRGFCAAVGIPPVLAMPLSEALRSAGLPD